VCMTVSASFSEARKRRSSYSSLRSQVHLLHPYFPLLSLRSFYTIQFSLLKAAYHTRGACQRLGSGGSLISFCSKPDPPVPTLFLVAPPPCFLLSFFLPQRITFCHSLSLGLSLACGRTRQASTLPPNQAPNNHPHLPSNLPPARAPSLPPSFLPSFFFSSPARSCCLCNFIGIVKPVIGFDLQPGQHPVTHHSSLPPSLALSLLPFPRLPSSGLAVFIFSKAKQFFL